MADNNVNLAALWVPVMPETKGLAPALKKAGEESRKAWTEGFSGSSSGSESPEAIGSKLATQMGRSFTATFEGLPIPKAMKEFMESLGAETKLTDAQLAKLKSTANSTYSEMAAAQEKVVKSQTELNRLQEYYNQRVSEGKAEKYAGTLDMIAKEQQNLASATALATQKHAEHSEALGKIEAAQNGVSSSSALMAAAVGGIAGVFATLGLQAVEKGFELVGEAIKKTAEIALEAAKQLTEVGEQYEGLKHQIVEFSDASGEGFEKLEASADRVFGKLDVSGENTGKVMSQLAAALHTDANPALEQLTYHVQELSGRFGTLNPASIGAAFVQFGIPVEEADKHLASLLESSRHAGVDFATVANGMKDISATAVQLGMDYNQTAAFAAAMLQHGETAQTISTALQHAEPVFAKRGLDFASGMKEAAKELEHLKAINDTTNLDALSQSLFGRRWTDGLALVESYSDVMSQLPGHFDATADSVDQVIAKSGDLGNAWEHVKHEIEEALKPLGVGFVSLLEGVTSQITNWINTHKPEIAAKVKELGDSFIDALPGIKEFAADAIQIVGQFLDFCKTGFSLIGGELALIGAQWEALFGDEKTSNSMLDASQKLFAINKNPLFDFGSKGDALSDWVRGLNIDVPKLKDNLKDLADSINGVGDASTALPNLPSSMIGPGGVVNLPLGTQVPQGFQLPPGFHFPPGTNFGSPNSPIPPVLQGIPPAPPPPLVPPPPKGPPLTKPPNEGGIVGSEGPSAPPNHRYDPDFTGAPDQVPSHRDDPNFTGHPLRHDVVAPASFDIPMSPGGGQGNSPDQLKALAASMFPWGPEEWPYFDWLVGKESSWTMGQVSSAGATGLGQFMPATWRNYGVPGGTNDPAAQLALMMQYIRDTYGTPSAAVAQYYNHPKGEGSYSTGGSVTGGIGSIMGALLGGPRGTDTVPAWLTPGEIVLNTDDSRAFRSLTSLASARGYDAGSDAHGAADYGREHPGNNDAGVDPQLLAIEQIANGMGLHMSSGMRYGPDPTTKSGKSFHQTGEAGDFVDDSQGNSDTKLAFAIAMFQHFGSELAELIYSDPRMPQLINAGHSVDPSFYGAGTLAQHTDHVHVAIRATQALSDQMSPGSEVIVPGGGMAPTNLSLGGPGSFSARGRGQFPGLPNQYGGLGAYGGETHDEAIAANQAVSSAVKRASDLDAEIKAKQKEIDDINADITSIQGKPPLLQDPAKLASDQERLGREQAALDKLKGDRIDQDSKIEEAKYKQGEAYYKVPKSAEGRTQKPTGEKEFEQLGQGLLKGVADELGLGDIFAKPPWEWGIFKIGAGLANWGIGTANAWADQIGAGKTGIGGAGWGNNSGIAMPGYDAKGRRSNVSSGPNLNPNVPTGADGQPDYSNGLNLDQSTNFNISGVPLGQAFDKVNAIANAAKGAVTNTPALPAPAGGG